MDRPPGEGHGHESSSSPLQQGLFVSQPCQASPGPHSGTMQPGLIASQPFVPHAWLGPGPVASQPCQASPGPHSCPMQPGLIASQPCQASPGPHSCPMQPGLIASQPCQASPGPYSCPMQPGLIASQPCQANPGPHSCPMQPGLIASQPCQASPGPYSCPMQPGLIASQPCQASPGAHSCPMQPNVIASQPFVPHAWLMEPGPSASPNMQPGIVASLPCQGNPCAACAVPVSVPDSVKSNQQIAQDLESNDPKGTGGIAPILLKYSGDKVLTGSYDQDGEDAIIAWDWARVPHTVGVQTQKDHYYLSRNKTFFESEFRFAEVPPSELRYKGKADQHAVHQHSCSSRGLILMLCLMVSNRRFSPSVKKQALSMLVSALRFSCQAIAVANTIVCTIYGLDDWHQHSLNFDNAGMSQDVFGLLSKHPPTISCWRKLLTTEFCGYKLASTLEHCSIWDLLVFLLWSKVNPTTKKVWQNVGSLLWPKIILITGQILEKAGMQSIGKQLEAVPLMRTKAGGHKRTPWVNKWVLLQKVKKNRRHRKEVMRSHADIVPAGADLVTQEQVIEVGVYLKKAQQAFKNARHLAISWDPSTYDQETLVSCLYSNQTKLHCYPPIQNIRPLVSAELEEELKELAAVNRLTRIEGFNELRALSHTLASIGCPLDKFFLPESILWKPLTTHERRVLVDGKWFIQNLLSRTMTRQLPPDLDVHQIPILVSLTDQGSLNRAGLDYTMYKLGACILPLYDPYHRVWNDLRDSLKKVSTLFKTFLSFALFFNINYGPAGSKSWFQKKQAKRKEFIERMDAHSNPFLQYLPFIQEERGLLEPSDHTGREEVFNTIHRLNNFNCLGPVAKLMRWFSWFSCEKFFEGEIWMTKMLMVNNLLPEDGVQSAQAKTPEPMHFPSNLTPKQELQKLKMQHGSYALAPMLVTPHSMHQKSLIALLCKPLWNHFAGKAKTVLTPTQVMEETIHKSSGHWKQELMDLMLNGFTSPAVFKKLYPERGSSDSTLLNDKFKERLQVHCQFLLHLIGKRTCSLVFTYDRPPFRYASLLVPSQRTSTQKQIQTDWGKLLSLEADSASGKNCGPIDSIHILSSSFMRLLFLLNEQDIAVGGSAASTLLEVAMRHQGDTACIESTHSSAKDILRDSRHNIRSAVHKQHAVQTSKVMDSRGWEHISVSDMEKATTNPRSLPAFIPFTNPNSHKLKKEFQKIMQEKSGQHWWPATTPQSLFNEVCSFEWLFHQQPKAKANMSSADLSCLVGKAGSLVAHRNGHPFLVLHAGNCGFVGWILKAIPSTHQFPAFECSTQLSSIQMQHIFDMQDWVDVPWTPESKESFGPVVFQQNAPARKLIMARLEEGLSLTVAQVNMVLALHSITPKRSRLDAYSALIALFIESEEQRKHALDRSIATVPQDEEQEEENEGYQELLDALDESGENKNDPDLKQEREKVKRRKPLGDGTTVGPKPRGRGRGRGKGKGKGKDKGKGRGKGRGRFGRRHHPEEPPAKRKKLDANADPATASAQEASEAPAAAALEATEPPALAQEASEAPAAAAPQATEPPALAQEASEAPAAAAPEATEPQLATAEEAAGSQVSTSAAATESQAPIADSHAAIPLPEAPSSEAAEPVDPQAAQALASAPSVAVSGICECKAGFCVGMLFMVNCCCYWLCIVLPGWHK